MALSLLAMFSYATTPPQPLARFNATKQERPADSGRNKKRQPRHEQAPHSGQAAETSTVGAHVDTSA